MERLDKFLCGAGAGTRSQVKLLLKAGRVTVDGAVEKDGSRKVDPAAVEIALDGQTLGGMRRAVVMLNKPAGFITATEDDSQATVMELLPPQWKHLDLKPVGRLDKDTEGLLLFTNDGELLHRLIAPKKGVRKVYYARHEGWAGEEDVRAFAQGLTLGDGTRCLPARLEPLGPGESLVTVCEGKYHQIKRMFAACGMHVATLNRITMGPLKLDQALNPGQYRPLSENEIQALLKLHNK